MEFLPPETDQPTLARKPQAVITEMWGMKRDADVIRLSLQNAVTATTFLK